MSAPRFQGRPLFLNGQTYIVPSLSLRQFQENEAAITAPIAPESTLTVQAAQVVPIILLAIQRNYPDITQDNLLDWLDEETFVEAYKIVRNSSGLKMVQPGEAQPA